MKRKKYCDDFERLWKIFDVRFGEKGSKTKAHKVFKLMEIDSQDVDYIIKCYNNQRESKIAAENSFQFVANFPHIERYLRDERFDDELPKEHYKRDASKSGKADQALREYLSGSYGKGLENLTGNEKSH